MSAGSRTGAIIASILMTSSAYAQTTIDVTKISCEQFINHEVVETDRIADWLAGFYAGKRGNTTVNLEQTRRNLQQLKNHCRYSQDNLMDAAERYLSSSE
jgi:acid stress chaperone HdeB